LVSLVRPLRKPLGEVLGEVLGARSRRAGEPGVGELENPESETELERGISPENRDFPL